MLKYVLIIVILFIKQKSILLRATVWVNCVFRQCPYFKEYIFIILKAFDPNPTVDLLFLYIITE